MMFTLVLPMRIDGLLSTLCGAIARVPMMVEHLSRVGGILPPDRGFDAESSKEALSTQAKILADIRHNKVHLRTSFEFFKKLQDACCKPFEDEASVVINQIERQDSVELGHDGGNEDRAGEVVDDGGSDDIILPESANAPASDFIMAGVDENVSKVQELAYHGWFSSRTCKSGLASPKTCIEGANLVLDQSNDATWSQQGGHGQPRHFRIPHRFLISTRTTQHPPPTRTTNPGGRDKRGPARSLLKCPRCRRRRHRLAGAGGCGEARHAKAAQVPLLPAEPALGVELQGRLAAGSSGPSRRRRRPSTSTRSWHGSVKPNEASIPEGDEPELSLDKGFDFSKHFSVKYELGEEVSRSHFGYTCTAKAKKGEHKGQFFPIKVIPKAKVR
ncbi:hypothetical protein ZWY2020_037931 [Hordeum vulgare]|nr:hypothetical protein ZWY2020_037927 [Hordeum vulgare]KAI4995843.1 hypothetical protein ZWY2020_037931 [Hordeum vulgare]